MADSAAGNYITHSVWLVCTRITELPIQMIRCYYVYLLEVMRRSSFVFYTIKFFISNKFINWRSWQIYECTQTLILHYVRARICYWNSFYCYFTRCFCFPHQMWICIKMKSYLSSDSIWNTHTHIYTCTWNTCWLRNSKI